MSVPVLRKYLVTADATTHLSTQTMAFMVWHFSANRINSGMWTGEAKTTYHSTRSGHGDYQ